MGKSIINVIYFSQNFCNCFYNCDNIRNCKSNDRIGGLIAAMPLTTFLILFWMYYENVSENKISSHINFTLLYLIATVPMFIIFPLLFK